MAFVPPIVFVNATPVTAADLESTFDTMRDYLNAGIRSADLKTESVTTNDIARGEYYGVVRDHQFTTCDIHTQFEEVDEFSRDYVGCQYKQLNLQSSKWVSIPNTGKRIEVEGSCHIFYTVSIAAHGDTNYQLLQEKMENFVKVYVARSDRIKDTDVQGATSGRYFTEDDVLADTFSSGNAWQYASTSSGGEGAYSRRWYTNHFQIIATDPGIYNIGLATVCNSDKAYFSARNANIEVFYRLGLEF